MAAWIGSALRMLAGGIALGAGSELAVRGIPGGIQSFGVGSATGAPFGGAGQVDGHPLFHTTRHPHRRRRRRALTQGDRDDISFIKGMISAAAAKDFAVGLATRAR